LTTIHKLISLSLLLLILPSCGSSSSTTEVGGATVTLEWNYASRGNTAKQVAREEVCGTNNIDQIRMRFLSGSTVTASQTFTCTVGTGTITGIPVGRYTLEIDGLTGEAVTWRGTKASATIVADVITDFGTVTMNYVGTTQTYSVTAIASANGSISPTGSSNVTSGQSRSFTVTPDTSYSIAGVTGCNGNLSGNTYTTGAITSACTVTASFSQTPTTTYTVTASAGSHGSITPSGDNSVISGQTKSFTVTPDASYSLASVTGCNGNLSGNTYTTGAITNACTVTASFSQIPPTIYTVTVTAGSNGSITPSGNNSVISGQTANFTVTPNSGYSVASVSGCNGNLSGNTYTTGAVSGACTVAASFSLTPSITYSISGTVATAASSGITGVTISLTGTGTTTAQTDISGNYTYAGAANGSYTLTPSLTGYSFSPLNRIITVNGANLPSQNFTGTPTVVSYTVSTTVSSGNGALNPTSRSIINGGTTTFTTTPGSGYQITSVTGCNGNLSGSTYTTGAITNACTVTASFSIIPVVTATIQLPKTGQTTCYTAVGNLIDCSGTGQDSDKLRGADWPVPRFTDNANGTVTDNLTGLIWLKNANCFNTQIWSAALTSANTLASGACGLSDGSVAGQWRLPNRKELQSLVDRSKYSPALPAGHPFTSVLSYYYWSSSSYASDATYAWGIGMYDGGVVNGIKSYNVYVWPVRDRQ
jgi:hypothetical protein